VCSAYFGFLICIANLCALFTTGWKPTFILLLFARPVLWDWEGGDKYVDQCDVVYNAQVSGLGLGSQHEYSVLSLAQY